MWRWRLRKLSGSEDTDLRKKKNLWHGETRECIYWAATYKDLRENGREKVSVKMVCSSVHHVEEMLVTQLCSRMDCCPWHTFIFHLTSPDATAFIPFSLFLSLFSELHKTSSHQTPTRRPVSMVCKNHASCSRVSTRNQAKIFFLQPVLIIKNYCKYTRWEFFFAVLIFCFFDNTKLNIPYTVTIKTKYALLI